MPFRETSFNSDIPPKQEKIKPLFGHCFEIEKLEEGDYIPVGGKNMLSAETDIKIEGDFENFQEFLKDVQELADKYDLPKLKEWLTSQGIEIDERLFAELFAFTRKFEQKYPNNEDNADSRKKLYGEQGKQLKLSDIFNLNSAACAEIAALAQKYLQQAGISSSYFSGDVLWDKEEEFSEEHSFIVIRQGGKLYIYDPTNPTNTTSGNFPSLYTVETNFDEEMAKNEKKFVATQNILNKKEAFYGVNNGTNVNAEKHIVKK